MLKTLELRGFRGFKSYALKDLTRVTYPTCSLATRANPEIVSC